MKKPNIQIWDIDRLIPYEKNVKIHDKKQVAVIKASLLEFGWSQPISVDASGSIIGGHGRRLATLDLVAMDPKWRNVPVWVRDDLTPEQVRALRLVDNKSAEGGIDTQMFRQELTDLDFDMTGFFTEKELTFSIADLGVVNMDAFIEDVSAAVDAQEAATKEVTAAVMAKPVPIGKLLGIDKVSAKNQLAVGRLMAEVELATGEKGEDALASLYRSMAKGK